MRHLDSGQFGLDPGASDLVVQHAPVVRDQDALRLAAADGPIGDRPTLRSQASDDSFPAAAAQHPAELTAGGAPTAAAGPGPAATLEARFDEVLRLLDRQTALTDRLHAENQRLRRGELRAALLLIVRDLVQLVDDTDRLIDAACDTRSAADLRIVRAALGDTLRRSGVIDVSPHAGALLDAKLHSVAGVAPTTDATHHATVIEVLRPGYAWDDGATIRVASVRVYKHSPAPAAAHSPAPAAAQSPEVAPINHVEGGS